MDSHLHDTREGGRCLLLRGIGQALRDLRLLGWAFGFRRGEATNSTSVPQHSMPKGLIFVYPTFSIKKILPSFEFLAEAGLAHWCVSAAVSTVASR